jgi:hypothetical protein
MNNRIRRWSFISLTNPVRICPRETFIRLPALNLGTDHRHFFLDSLAGNIGFKNPRDEFDSIIHSFIWNILQAIHGVICVSCGTKSNTVSLPESHKLIWTRKSSIESTANMLTRVRGLRTMGSLLILSSGNNQAD